MEAGTYQLHQLEPGQKGKIGAIKLAEDMKQRLEDIGFTSGSVIECVYRSPWGDPTAYFIKGTLIALRSMDASGIMVEMEAVMEGEGEQDGTE